MKGGIAFTQPELIESGLEPDVDPALLHLYAEAIEQPIRVVAATPGPGGFGPQAEICFYGTGINTLYSGTRIYWLTAEPSQGARIPQMPTTVGSNQPPASFSSTVELVPHTTYFAALINPDGNNFFGPLVSSTALDQTMQVPHLDATSVQSAHIEVSLQGIILAFPHDVAIALNGSTLGEVSFTGQDKGKFGIEIPSGLLQEGTNTITLTAQDGEYDTSLLQAIRITYPRTYAADADSLVFTGQPGEELQVPGFTQTPIAVFDITDPIRPGRTFCQCHLGFKVGQLRHRCTSSVDHDKFVDFTGSHSDCRWRQTQFAIQQMCGPIIHRNGTSLRRVRQKL